MVFKMAVKVAINGFGRVGRHAFRQMFGSPDFEVAAINDLTSPEMLAHLLKYDSSQGRYDKEISHNGDSIVVGGIAIPIYKEREPEKLPWGKLNVDVVLECTGFFASKKSSMAHIEAGVKKSLFPLPPATTFRTSFTA